MDRKPLSLEKENFNIPAETDHYPLIGNDMINIKVEEKNGIIPSLDNSRDEYISKINKIESLLSYISNNLYCIRNNSGYVQISNEAASFCSSMRQKMSINERDIYDYSDKAAYYIEKTEAIVKYIDRRKDLDNELRKKKSAIEYFKNRAKSEQYKSYTPKSGIFLIVLLIIKLLSLIMMFVFSNSGSLGEIFMYIYGISSALLYVSIVLFSFFIGIKNTVEYYIEKIHEKREIKKLDDK